MIKGGVRTTPPGGVQTSAYKHTPVALTAIIITGPELHEAPSANSISNAFASASVADDLVEEQERTGEGRSARNHCCG
ncbi:hypothetical protein GCM10010303_79370 [Streptomyces purpurascens]|nr:hypothetical protein GCM10010303_79370 [Streptomyces purpurascens]